MPHTDSESVLNQLVPILASASFPDRRLGRVLAFLALYESDQSHHPVTPILERLITDTDDPAAPRFEPELVQSASEYAREILNGVQSSRREIDGVIQERAPAWPLNQMSAIDRNVLRVGLYETLHGNAKVPVKAAINEAVELAKMFGSETSAKFVNGVLGRAVQPAETSG
jgi:N utilization substance protein B